MTLYGDFRFSGNPNTLGQNMQRYLIVRPVRPFVPPTDVVELDDRLVVMVEIAGMRAGDFNITLQRRRLIVSGVRERPVAQDNPAYHQLEIGYGEFRLEFDIPWPVDGDAISASYHDGFLQIDLPRKAAMQVHIVDLERQEQE
jgi:HSP20 family protein